MATSPAFPDHGIGRVDVQGRAAREHRSFYKKGHEVSRIQPESKETTRPFEQWRGAPEHPPQCRPPEQQPHLERRLAEGDDEGREDKAAATESRSRGCEERKSDEGAVDLAEASYLPFTSMWLPSRWGAHGEGEVTRRTDRGAAKSENQMRERSTERKPPTSRSPRCGCRAAGGPTGR
jgi:hypothetical protein